MWPDVTCMTKSTGKLSARYFTEFIFWRGRNLALETSLGFFLVQTVALPPTGGGQGGADRPLSLTAKKKYQKSEMIEEGGIWMRGKIKENQG